MVSSLYSVLTKLQSLWPPSYLSNTPKSFLSQGLCTSSFLHVSSLLWLQRLWPQARFQEQSNLKMSYKPLILQVWEEFIFLLILTQWKPGTAWCSKERAEAQREWDIIKTTQILGGRLSKDGPRGCDLDPWKWRRKFNLNILRSPWTCRV